VPLDGQRAFHRRRAGIDRPGRCAHFETATGVFVHALSNPDWHAQGTQTELGIHGDGAKEMRVGL
jgi:hypothetical protein